MLRANYDEFAHTMAEIICTSPNKTKFGIIVGSSMENLNDLIRLDKRCKINYKFGGHFYKLDDFPIIKSQFDESILIKPRSYNYDGLYELYKLCKMLQQNNIISTVKMGYVD